MERTLENMKLVLEALEALVEWEPYPADLVKLGRMIILIEEVKLDIAELELGHDSVPV